MNFDREHAAYLARCKAALEQVAKQYFTAGSTTAEAALYSLLNGGKRVRGVLVMAVCNMMGGCEAPADIYAAAVEMVHTYSLIHDDLPCMDDDDMRRGKPANHIVYGETTALLAGDLLLTTAFETIAACGSSTAEAAASCESRANAVAALAKAAGGRGMVFGQELDLQSEHGACTPELLQKIHRNKTGALITGAAHLGVIAAGGAVQNEGEITRYAQNIGLAFQIVDDVLDKTSSVEALGKPVGSDFQREKITFVSLYGVERSKEIALALTTEAVAAVERKYGEKSAFLTEFAHRLSKRLR